MPNPFASEPEPQPEPANEVETTNSVWEDTTVDSTPQDHGPTDLHRVRITLKGGSGYEAPWITVDGADISDAKSTLEDAGDDFGDLLNMVATASTSFQTEYSNSKQKNAPAENKGGGFKKASSNQGGKNSVSPDGQVKECQHGAMTYREGTNKNGNPYRAFFCPASDRSEQCKPVFL